MKTETLLPYTRVSTYDLKHNADKVFNTPADADAWIARSGSKSVNIYRIPCINGEWRTDWELA